MRSELHGRRHHLQRFYWFGSEEIQGLTGKKTTIKASSDSASGSGDDDGDEGWKNKILLSPSPPVNFLNSARWRNESGEHPLIPERIRTLKTLPGDMINCACCHESPRTLPEEYGIPEFMRNFPDELLSNRRFSCRGRTWIRSDLLIQMISLESEHLLVSNIFDVLTLVEGIYHIIIAIY